MRNGETQAEGGENADLIAGKRENMKNLIGVMTKLLIPKPQVTLSQVPPSKKETWGAESNPSFPAHPRANSRRASVAYEPADVQR
jgi:hypothetical protein